MLMNLSRVGLLAQGYSEIRASAILQIFRDQTPQSMRAVSRSVGGRVMTVNRVAIL
jgi:hypothetical protein